MKKLEVLANIKKSNGEIWGRGLIFDERKGQTIPRDLLNEVGRMPKIVEVTDFPKPDEPVAKPEPPQEKEIVQDEITFSSKGQIRQAKKDDLIVFLGGEDSLKNLSRDILIDKALKKLDEISNDI